MTGITLFSGQWLGQRSGDADYLFRENRGGGGPPDPISIHPRYRETVSPNSDSLVRLDFTFDDFDPNNGSLQGHLSALFNPNQYIRRFPQSKPPPQITVVFYSVFEVTAVKVPLVSQDATPEEVPAVPITLEAWGDLRAFPNDRYAIAYFLSINDAGFSYPEVSVLTGLRLSGYDISASVDSLYLNFLLHREALQEVWVYVIAASPFFLLVALVWASLKWRRDAGVMAIEAAVGLVALLPLRQVLVPPELGTFTRIDLLLGLEFLAIICWMVIAVGAFVPGHSK